MNNHQSEIGNHQSHWRWWICGALLLATLLNYMDRQALSEIATEMKERYHLDDARYGNVERGFSYAFATGSILFGFLADRFGPRRLYPIVLIGWSLAGVATTFAASPEAVRWLEDPGDEPGTGTFRWLLICRTVLGLFEAGHWPCALITARQVLTAADRPFGNSLLQSGASLGAVLTPLYVLLVRSLGGSWQVVFWTIGIAGLLWVPMWFALVRKGDLDDKPAVPSDPELDEAGVPHGPPEPHEPIDVWGFVRRVFVLAVIVTCLGLSWQFIRAWLPKYLKEFHKYTPAASAWAVACYYIAADLGCILAGFLVRLLAGSRRSVHTSRVIVFALWCGLTALAAVVPLIGNSFWVLVPVLMLVGAGILGLHPIYYALAQELPHKHMGLLSGLLAALTWVTVGTLQGMIGAHIKETGSYAPGFILAGLAPLVGLVVLVLVWKPAK
ncbi:MAG: MFS transporter [Planctomycetia bacterium]|nr:MFS transporter [Planctomycetia bacterium]